MVARWPLYRLRDLVGKGGHINRVSLRWRTARGLTRRTAYYSSPVYSPDGSKIVFVSGATDDQLYADLHYRDNDVFPDAT